MKERRSTSTIRDNTQGMRAIINLTTSTLKCLKNWYSGSLDCQFTVLNGGQVAHLRTKKQTIGFKKTQIISKAEK